MGDMEVMLIFLAGVFMVFIIAILSIVRMSTSRTTASIHEEMKQLNKELMNSKMKRCNF